MRPLLPLALASALALSACSSSRTPLPLPPIQPAPAEIASLRVFVINASHEAARDANETTVTGYTIQMRGAVQRSLVRAGLTVVVMPTHPADLLAKVDIEHPSIGKLGLASMTLTTPEGVVVDQLSNVIGLDENVDIDERGPVSLVEKLIRSPRVAAFARDHSRPACEIVKAHEKKVLEVPEDDGTPPGEP